MTFHINETLSGVQQVLDEAGFDVSDFVEITTFHLDINNDMDDFVSVR